MADNPRATPVPDDGVRSRQRQIAGDLRALILAGDIGAGDRLPSTAALRLRYGANNMTITRALAILKGEGLVEGHKGRSVVATGRRPEPVRAEHRPPLGDPDRTTRLIEVREGPAPARVAEAFGLSAGEPVLIREQIALLGAEPVELVWNYYPVALARGTALAEPRLLRGGSPVALAALGCPLRSAVDHVSARPATALEVIALKLPGDVPVLRQFRVAYTDRRRPVEVGVVVKPGQRFEIRYEVPLEKAGG